jgi:hypothetical protein
MDAAIKGDTAKDEDQLHDALAAWASKSPKGTAEVTKDDDGVRFHSCDPGKDAKAAGKDVTPDTLALPVIRTDVYTEAIAADQTPKQSACFANGVVEAFTVEQLNDPDGSYVSSDAGQQKLAGVRERCFS